MTHPAFDMDCRYCGARMRCSEDSSGKKVRCPMCGSASMVDLSDESAEREHKDKPPPEELDLTVI